MKFRFHRGSLAESMATAREFSTSSDLVEFVLRHAQENGVPCVAADVSTEPQSHDKRVGWNSHLLLVKGWGVVGMTDGPL